MSDLAQRFADAQARIKPVTGLGNDVLLDLYALFNQSTVGYVTGSRPVCPRSTRSSAAG